MTIENASRIFKDSRISFWNKIRSEFSFLMEMQANLLIYSIKSGCELVFLLKYPLE